MSSTSETFFGDIFDARHSLNLHFSYVRKLFFWEGERGVIFDVIMFFGEVSLSVVRPLTILTMKPTPTHRAARHTKVANRPPLEKANCEHCGAHQSLGGLAQPHEIATALACD